MTKFIYSNCEKALMAKKKREPTLIQQIYPKDALSKTVAVSFAAGLAGGGTLYIYTMIMPWFFEGYYVPFLLGFVAFVIVGTLLLLATNLIMHEMFGKRRKNS